MSAIVLGILQSTMVIRLECVAQRQKHVEENEVPWEWEGDG